MNFMLGMITALILNYFYNKFKYAILMEQFEIEWEKRSREYINLFRE
jgi:hypothetical protein